MSNYIISYDISNEKKRRKISKKLEKIGRRLQKSVFIADLSEINKNQLKKELGLTVSDTDSLLFIPCCSNCMENAEIICKKNRSSVIL